MFNWDKKFTTRDGRPARWLAKDLKRNSPCTVVVAVETNPDHEVLYTYRQNGQFLGIDREHNLDLVNVSERMVRYYNVFPNVTKGPYFSLQDANNSSDYILFEARLAILKITHEHGMISREALNV